MDAANTLVLYHDNEDDRRAHAKMQDSVAAILRELNDLASEAATRRTGIEQRWLSNLRQYHGIYAEDVMNALKADRSSSRIYINITRAKTNAWIARLGDMLFPNDERNWGINPTPVPTLSEQAREISRQIDELEMDANGLADQHNAMVDMAGGEPIDSGLPPQIDAKIDEAKALRDQERQVQREKELAEKRAQAMQNLIADQLVESNYPARCRDVIEDMCKVGIGILKGPIINDKPRRSWRQETAPDGAPLPNVYRLTPSGDTTPRFRRVDYWHFFPDPSAQTMEECEYTFERHLPNKKMLRRMAREMNFYKPAVAQMLKEGPNRNTPVGSADLNFLTELRILEQDDTTQGNPLDSLKDRFLLWEYHGPLELEQVEAILRAHGRDEDAARFADATALEVPMVRIFFSGSHLLKLEEDYLLDSGASLYSVATFEKGEASVLGGVGVPHLMSHEQTMLNSAIRMLMDNAALAVAPQVVIDKELIEPEDRIWKLAPRKVWQWVKTATRMNGGKEKPFETFDIPINQQSLAAIIELSLRFIDEVISMPLIAQGEMGAHVTKTSSGMSMLFNSANVGFRRVVKNWDDDVTTGTIRRTYDFNMQFSEREDVKGDMQAEARGTSVLLVRELQAEQLMTIIREWAAHPILGVGFRAYHSMRLVLQAMSINPDDLLLAEEDYYTKLKMMSEGGEESPEQIRAQAAIQTAQIDAQSRETVANINLEASRIRAQTAMVELAQNREISLSQIQAMFKDSVFRETTKAGIEKEKIASGERKFAAEVGVERENAREARAAGMQPTGSGGYISAGQEPVERAV